MQLWALAGLTESYQIPALLLQQHQQQPGEGDLAHCGHQGEDGQGWWWPWWFGRRWDQRSSWECNTDQVWSSNSLR